MNASSGGGVGVLGFPQHPSPLTPKASDLMTSTPTRGGGGEGTGKQYPVDAQATAGGSSSSSVSHAASEAAQHSRRHSGNGGREVVESAAAAMTAGAAAGSVQHSRRHSATSSGGGGEGMNGEGSGGGSFQHGRRYSAGSSGSGGGAGGSGGVSTEEGGRSSRRNSGSGERSYAEATAQGPVQSSRRNSATNTSDSTAQRTERGEGDRRRRQNASPSTPPTATELSSSASSPQMRTGRDVWGGKGGGSNAVGADQADRNSPPAKPPDSAASHRGRPRRGDGGDELMLPAELPGLGSARTTFSTRCVNVDV